MRAAIPALLAVVLLAPGASAAEPQIVDVAGDANAVNDQNLTGSDVTVSLPAQADSFDVRSVRFATYRAGRRPAGFTVTMALGGKPGPASAYVVRASAPGCAEIWLEYIVAETGDRSALLRHRCTATGPADFSTNVRIDAAAPATAITWTVPFAVLPKGVGNGVTLSKLVAESRTLVVVTTHPVVDLARSTGTYRIGS